jgi:hypothetical protein
MDLRKMIQQEINSALSGINQQRFLDPIKTKVSRNSGARRILQFTKDGTFIKEFDSIADANRELGVSDKYVSKHLRGVSKTCKGFIFKYKD